MWGLQAIVTAGGLRVAFENPRLLPLTLRAMGESIHDIGAYITAGTIARTVSAAVVHPLDTYKTRLQLHQNLASQGPVLGSVSEAYLGFSGAVLGMVPTALLYFAGYEAASRLLSSTAPPGGLTHVVSAAVGATLSCLVRVPSDTIKHRVQAGLYPSSAAGLQSILAEQGVLGLYRGFGPTLLRDIPEIAVQFSMYEALRGWTRQQGLAKAEGSSSPLSHLLLGGVSGALSAFVTAPLDLVKTAMQCSVARAGAPKTPAAVLYNIYSTHGLAGCFAGAGPRVAMNALMSGVFFLTFEVGWPACLSLPRTPGDPC